MSRPGVPASVLVALLAAVALWLARPTPHAAPEAAQSAAHGSHYQCAMHPQIVSQEPGVCPICRMKLQRVDDEPHAEASSAPRTPLFYRHPMRADVVSSVPAKDEMGMAYLPVYENDAAPAGGDVPGHASFVLSNERQQLIGITTGTVERRSLEVSIRAAGKVAYDPKLYQALVEYQTAMRGRGGLTGTPSSGDALLRGARLKLRQQGLSDELIDTLTREGRDPIELLLPGKSVWIYAQVYEYEAALLAPGQPMEVTALAPSGPPLTTRIAAIDPIVDPTTRTVRVRGLLATPEQNLRPESFVRVTIHVPLGEKLAVPEEAVLDTGDHQIVFTVLDGGAFEPRSVELGREAGGYYEVRAGLSEGERVVTSANFLVDSESRFRAALAAFKRAPADAR